MHFDIITISRIEKRHAILKHQLRLFNENLKIIVNVINFLLINELYDHILIVNKIKMWMFLRFRKSIFQQIFFYVFSYILRKVLEQYFLIIDKSTILRFCIDAFTIILKFSCCHKFAHFCWFYCVDILLNLIAIFFSKWYFWFFFHDRKFSNDKNSKTSSKSLE